VAKTKRGSALWKTPARARGTCPICFSTRIKLLYTKTKSDGKQITVCKRCDSASSKRINNAMNNVQGLAFRGKHRKEFHKLVNKSI
jgi:hypothetical protein